MIVLNVLHSYIVQKPYTVSGPTPACPLPPLSSCLPPLPHSHPPFPLLPLHCKKLEDSVYNPSYSLPIGGYLYTFTFCRAFLLPPLPALPFPCPPLCLSYLLPPYC